MPPWDKIYYHGYKGRPAVKMMLKNGWKKGIGGEYYFKGWRLVLTESRKQQKQAIAFMEEHDCDEVYVAAGEC